MPNVRDVDVVYVTGADIHVTPLFNENIEVGAVSGTAI